MSQMLRPVFIKQDENKTNGNGVFFFARKEHDVLNFGNIIIQNQFTRKIVTF